VAARSEEYGRLLVRANHAFFNLKKYFISNGCDKIQIKKSAITSAAKFKFKFFLNQYLSYHGN